MPNRIHNLKTLAAGLSAMALILWCIRPAGASWIIDPAEFHASPHGRFSCVDCHEDISEKKSHPDPGNVNKRLTDFFNPDECLACHYDISEDLEKGVHGEETGIDPDRYEGCIYCHDPHTRGGTDRSFPDEFNPEKPAGQQCGACHISRSALPEPGPHDKECMECHAVNLESGPGESYNAMGKLCFSCHGEEYKDAKETASILSVPVIDEGDYARTSHARVGCIACHPESARYGHTLQEQGDCTRCHTFHHEKETGDPHMIVECGACHLRNITPSKDPDTKQVTWERKGDIGWADNVHHMLVDDDEISCERCHFEGNEVGASSMVLPSKNFICMPCHTATFSAGDVTTAITLIVFLAGMAMVFSYVFSGSGPSIKNRKRESSAGIFRGLVGLIADVFMQRRLFRQSISRWFIHGLIFFPFVFRFLWGIVALLGSLFIPDAPWVWEMVNKNDPMTAFMFDFSGIIMIIGVFSALARGLLCGHDQPPGLPKQDRPALILIALIIVIGFILEGMRIAMTGWPEGSGYGIAGYAISRMFSGYQGLTGLYGYVWYAHAIATGLFIAYIPFSRLIHIIFAPVVMGVNSIYGKGTFQIKGDPRDNQ